MASRPTTSFSSSLISGSTASLLLILPSVVTVSLIYGFSLSSRVLISGSTARLSPLHVRAFTISDSTALVSVPLSSKLISGSTALLSLMLPSAEMALLRTASSLSSKVFISEGTARLSLR